VITVSRSRFLSAPPPEVWRLVSSVERLPEWLTFAEAAETLEGEGAGRLQRIHGHWGKQRSEVDQRITGWEAPRRLEWRHEAERLDGKPSPVFARETRVEVRLEPEGDGTRVTLESAQVPASPLKGLLLRLLSRRQLGNAYTRSLERLDSVVSAVAPSKARVSQQQGAAAPTEHKPK